jgi:hypothetical protein
MIGKALRGPLRLGQALQRFRQFHTRRDEHRKMIESAGAAHTPRLRILVQHYNVFAACAQLRDTIGVAVNLKAQHVAIELDRAIEIGHSQRHVPQRHIGIGSMVCHVVTPAINPSFALVLTLCDPLIITRRSWGSASSPGVA